MNTRILFKSTFAAVMAGTLSLSFILSGCAGQSIQSPTKNPSGFLPDYSLLQPISNAPKGSEIYMYKAPDVSRGDYRAVLIEPVSVYQNQAALNNALSAAQSPADQEKIKADFAKEQANAQSIQATIQAGIESVVSQKMPLVNSAGPRVAKLSVAITGAMLETEGFKPWNIIPVSAVITLASNASGKNSKTPAVMVELKFTDSQTGKLLKEVVTVIRGDSFRSEDNSSQAFADLAKQWVQEAMTYSASQH